MSIKIIKFLIIHFLDKNDDFLVLSFGRDEFTDYQIIKVTYDKDGMKTYGTRDCREEQEQNEKRKKK